jgi:hypothetical protein
MARRRRDAVDSLTKNAFDAIYRIHGSHDARDGIHPGTAANAVEFVDVQFANFIVEIGHVGLLSNKEPFPCFNRWSQGYAMSFIVSVIHLTLSKSATRKIKRGHRVSARYGKGASTAISVLAEIMKREWRRLG